MENKRFARLALSAAAAAALAFGCRSVRTARTTQAALAGNGSTNAVDILSRDIGGNPPEFLFAGTASPDEYVAYALTNRPDIAKAELDVASAGIAAGIAGAGRWPQVSGRAGYSRATANRKTGGDWRTEGSWSAGIDLDLMIYDFGKISAQERAAAENLVAAAAALEDAKLAAACEVRTAYFAWLHADAMLAVSRTNEMQRAEHLRQARERFEVGDVRKLDVTQAQLNHSNAGLALIRASNEVATASATLMKSIGVSAAVTPAPAGIGLGRPAYGMPATSMTAAEAIDFARTNAPSLALVRARFRAASARVDYAIADLYPTLSLGTAFNFSNPDFPATWNWSWAGNLAGSIFQGFRKTLAVDASVAELMSAAAGLREAEQALALQVAVAAADRDTARRAHATARLIVRQARENLDVVTEEYRVGEASSIDYLDAVASYTQALGERVEAFYTEQTAEAKLARLIGLSPRAAPFAPQGGRGRSGEEKRK